MRQNYRLPYEIDWKSFGSSIHKRWKRPIHLELDVGLFHATAHRAWQGKPVGTEIFLAICARANFQPLTFLKVRNAA